MQKFIQLNILYLTPLAYLMIAMESFLMKAIVLEEKSPTQRLGPTPSYKALEPTLKVAQQPWNQLKYVKALCLRLGASKHWIQLQDVSRVMLNTNGGGT